ncbi:helix-turn-helix domain-containing protein [Haloarcula sp. 1CSR25-25]|uniref:helix-turn-helix domain-containing protein n=1 Tax=Haloarcula sp. 1CSR25-25 TaxID=2862545 RepID=UPI002893DC74|nr:helix-turn-helix domain-containing protein [Haloarcula sp. 1CSR25-25]MDT3436001.1 helix-turn-helix domain-containing protein [Haloarcula sp. 1CSR25-25]
MHRVTLDTWLDGCPLGRVTASHDVALTTPYWNVSPETGRCDLWVEAASSERSQLEAGIRALRDADAVTYFELKRKRGLRATTRVLLEDTVAIETVLANGGAVIGPFTDIDGRERWHLGFADADAVDTALGQLDRRHEFTVVEQTALDDRRGPSVFRHFDEATALLDGCTQLTETEARVLRTAVTRGYYETPREETLASLGDQCGISDAAVSKTLRRAERKLLGAAVTALNGLDEPLGETDYRDDG